MKPASLYVALGILFALLNPSAAYRYDTNRSPSPNAVLLSSVQTLTLHSHRKTTHRRVPAIPQLSCVGPPDVCALYNVETMRCVNAGYDYDENDVQWTCTADVPPEFRLGSTDVVCEGYRSAEDPWVLKGSCGVEYRLLLTKEGERRYGKQYSSSRGSWGPNKVFGGRWRDIPGNIFDFLFSAFAIGILVFMLAMSCCGFLFGGSRNNGHFGGGGGGGPGWGAPPPYDPYPKADSWRPGFWSGALGGAAAGYAMGRESRRNSRPGPSTWGSGSAGPSRASSLSNTVESTGFGSTRRR